MAVVIAKYIQPDAQAKGKAKGTIRYNEHRPGKDKQRIWRTLFNSDGQVSRQQGYDMVDNAAPGSVYWRIKISPDPKIEDARRDLSMQELTDTMITTLQHQLGKDVQYVAAIHADHTDKRHVHLVAVLPKLSRQEFQRLPDILRQGATASCELQRQELDQVREHRKREKEKEAQWERER